MESDQIEAIERATVSAVSPDALAEIPGWLLPFDAGTVGRAKSAVPLAHAAPEPSALPEIESHYAPRGLPVVLRVPMLATFEAFRRLLAAQGYREEIPTQVLTARAPNVVAVSAGEAARLHVAPTQDWASVFLGEGFDPVDGANRVEKLGRATDSLFATIEENGRAVAAGAAAFSHGWASVHGMRTAQGSRGRGLAARVLATLAGAAIGRGYDQVFLQVSGDNAPAQALYRRAGFAPVWTYSYWRKPAP